MGSRGWFAFDYQTYNFLSARPAALEVGLLDIRVWRGLGPGWHLVLLQRGGGGCAEACDESGPRGREASPAPATAAHDDARAGIARRGGHGGEETGQR